MGKTERKDKKSHRKLYRKDVSSEQTSAEAPIQDRQTDARDMVSRPSGYDLGAVNGLRFRGLTNRQFGEYLLEVSPRLQLPFRRVSSVFGEEKILNEQTARYIWDDVDFPFTLLQDDRAFTLYCKQGDAFREMLRKQHGLNLKCEHENIPLFVLEGKASQAQQTCLKFEWTLWWD